MKNNPIKNIISKNTIFILLFVILISCDSMGESDNGEIDDMVSPDPTMQPEAPPGMPITGPGPTMPPVAPPMNPAPPAPAPNPMPNPTNMPAPTPSPTTGPNPTPAPTNAPAPTLSPTMSPNPTPSPTQAPVPTPQPTSAPTPTPPGQPLNEFQAEVLNLVNEARAQSRNCGSDFLPSAPPVIWDVRIEAAAFKHSQDMAENDYFDHISPDGYNPGDRLLMQGYNWSTWGENILVGLSDARDAIDGWLDSPGHCRIIMSQSFEEVGAAVVQGFFGGGTASYWTLDFATER